MCVSNIIEGIYKYADDQEYFDIYQICAFDSVNDRKAYKASFFKAISCLLLQIPSLIYVIYSMMNETRGMNCIIVSTWDNKPNFLNGHWLRIGVYYNMVASCLAVAASYAIIFLADNPLDLVLNSVA